MSRAAGVSRQEAGGVNEHQDGTSSFLGRQAVPSDDPQLRDFREGNATGQGFPRDTGEGIGNDQREYAARSPQQTTHPDPREETCDCPTNAIEASTENYQDRCEIAFFLRHFCEGPGQWMDICGGQSYFSQNAVVLAHWSPLVRYAACALGAKQLGQTRRPELQIRQTNTQSLMMGGLIETKLGFTWYGAKYYEKAIQLLAKQISSNDHSTFSSSPGLIYGSGLTPQEHRSRERNEEELPFQILAACILCQYEDVNATIRAWTGHLDGAFRLLRPHCEGIASFHDSSMIPQPSKAVHAVLWFLVINDMLNACMFK